MGNRTADVPVTERVWDELEARLSHGETPPLRFLYATDGSEPAAAAERLLALLPLPAGSALQVVTVLDALPWQIPETLKAAELEWADRVVTEAEARLASLQLRLSHTVVRGTPAAEIVRAAEAFRADLVVVGSHGRTGMERLWLGSVAENVAKHAPGPVLVAREPAHGLRSVVVAVDGSEHSRRAVRLAAHLPLPAGTKITVCHVLHPFYPLLASDYTTELDVLVADVQKQQQAHAQTLLHQTAAELERWGKPAATVIRGGNAAVEIMQLALEQEADLIILGAQGHSAFRGLAAGSVAGRVLRGARCSVLFAR